MPVLRMIIVNFVNASAEGNAGALSQKRSQHFKLDFCCQGMCVLRMIVSNFVNTSAEGDAVALSQKRSQHFKLDFCC